jgi:leucyl-tRNA synthetase
MVCKETLSCAKHGYLFPEQVALRGDRTVCTQCGGPVEVGRVEKMSKSKKNVVDPNLLLTQYGADTTRLFCLFAAPPERDLEWSEQGVDGGYRFLNRVWRLVRTWLPLIQGVDSYKGEAGELEGEIRAFYKKTHETIKKVTSDIEDRFHFNTAISAIMELVNAMYGIDAVSPDPRTCRVMRSAAKSVVLLLSPIVPHFAEELWEALGNTSSVLLASWPSYSEKALVREEVLIVIQVNGKLRGRFTADPDVDDETLKKMALSDEQARKFIQDKPVKKVIVVKKKLVNIVV